MKEIILSTGDINKDYEIIDIIFAIDKIKDPYFSGPQYSETFDNVKKQLKQKGSSLNADAVIYCNFEYQHSKNSIHEIFAYGTCIKFK
jgi:hypothetical protein